MTAQEAITELFNHEDFGEVRVTMLEHEPWFHASDVASALGYVNSRNAIARHCKRAKSLMISTAPKRGGVEPPKIIPESDVYRLIARSHKKEAEAFMDWLYEEVLPVLRKRGEYKVQEVEEPKPVADNGPNLKDGFFQDLRPILKATVDSMMDLGLERREAGARAFQAIKEHYNIDLERYFGPLFPKEEEPVPQLETSIEPVAVITKGASKLFSPEQLGCLLESKWSAFKVNKKLREMELQDKEFYTSNGVRKDRWCLTEEGEHYGEELELSKIGSDGKHKTWIKWHPEVLEVIAPFEERVV